jgi:hypothetical protein
LTINKNFDLSDLRHQSNHAGTKITEKGKIIAADEWKNVERKMVVNRISENSTNQKGPYHQAFFFIFADFEKAN